MTRHRVRLVERVIEEDSCDFIGGRFVIENSGLCRLLDEAGQETKEVIPEREGTTADEQQRSAQGACGPERTGTMEPGS